MQWPLEDHLLIYEWLLLASEWPFVKEVFPEEMKACLSFWSKGLTGGWSSAADPPSGPS